MMFQLTRITASISLLLLSSSSVLGQQQELNDAKALWESQGLESYNYTYQRRCECPDEDTVPKLVEVVDDVVVAVNGVAVTSVARAATNVTVPPTIDGLFDSIQDGINQTAFIITVTYDSTYGYPTDIFIDYDEQTADDELDVTAKLEGVDEEEPTGAPTSNTTAPEGTTAPTSAPTSAAVNQQTSGRMMAGLVPALFGVFSLMV
eukprot:scaffold1567_cov102-Cylindrotheca_fusiformis.AAC.10